MSHHSQHSWIFFFLLLLSILCVETSLLLPCLLLFPLSLHVLPEKQQSAAQVSFFTINHFTDCHGKWGGFLTAGRKQMERLSSRRARRETLDNYRLASLISVPDKVMEQTTLEAISKHVRTRRWSEVVSMDIWRGNHAWATWSTSMTKVLAWWTRGCCFSLLQQGFQHSLPRQYPNK